MKTSTSILILLAGFLGLGISSASAQDTFGSGGNTFSIDFVDVGNAGNGDDDTGYGGVADTFRMGTYEISREMITKANAASGNLNITLNDMTSYGGNGANRPATGVSWNEAARFVNWLNTSSGYSAAYKFAAQPGDVVGYSANANLELWTISDAGYDASNPYRNANATYFLPSEDEWYKAAYYSGTGSTYFDYALGSDIIPGVVTGGTTAGTAVYGLSTSTGPADISNAGGLSPYGVMGMTGNVWEWNESAFDGVNNLTNENRGRRGGFWNSMESFLRSSTRLDRAPSDELDTIGFRVAAIPEPSTWILVAILMGTLIFVKGRG